MGAIHTKDELDRLNERASLTRLFDLPAPHAAHVKEHIPAADQQLAQPALRQAPPAAPQDRPEEHEETPSTEFIPASESVTCEQSSGGRKVAATIEFRSPDLAGSRAQEFPLTNQQSGTPYHEIRLTPLEAAFTDALLRSPTLDCRQSYLTACKATGKAPGKDEGGAARALYQREKVQQDLARRRRYHETAIDAQTVQLEHVLARVAFADLRTLYGADGQILPPDQWPDDIAAAIGGLETEETTTDRGERGTETTVSRKVKLVDRLAAARLLLARRGLAQDRDAGGGFVAHFHIDIGG